jgi:acyl-CoA dehydrogenase
MYVPQDEHDAVGAIEHALIAVIAVEPLEAKMREAQKTGNVAALSPDDAALLERARVLRDRVIHVDDFPANLNEESAHAL